MKDRTDVSDRGTEQGAGISPQRGHCTSSTTGGVRYGVAAERWITWTRMNQVANDWLLKPIPSSADQSLGRYTPKVEAAYGKVARTVLGGERAMKRALLPLQPLNVGESDMLIGTVTVL